MAIAHGSSSQAAIRALDSNQTDIVAGGSWLTDYIRDHGRLGLSATLGWATPFVLHCGTTVGPRPAVGPVGAVGTLAVFSKI